MPKKILIIGAGPAGLCGAIFLSKKGYEITLIDRASKKDASLKVGESLPPDAKQLLENLELWDAFEQAGHLRCYGNQSIWGSSTISYTDFIHHPIGYGWHIDRNQFEEMLFEKAIQSGAQILERTKVTQLDFQAAEWAVHLKTEDGQSLEQYYDFLVDASGRNSWLARQLGHERLYEDQQLALVTFLKIEKEFEDSSSLIETTPYGWWYSTKIPKGRIATAFLCKPDVLQRVQWLQPSHWWDLLKKGIHTAKRIADSQATILEAPRFVNADSSILETPFGKAWIAIGDAAMSYDPIASHGLLMSMVSARDSAEAIEQYFTGAPEALENYSAVLWQAFQHYVQQRQQFYQAESRFSGSAYWDGSSLPVGE